MSDLCVCMRDVISELNSEIEGSLAFCALMLFLCCILCPMCSGSSVYLIILIARTNVRTLSLIRCLEN